MITDEILAQAAAELADAINASLPAPEECQHQFSAKFERKMNRLIYRTNHPIQHRILRSAASILLVILLGFSSVLAVSVEAREAIFGWVREQYESFYEYFFEGQPKYEEPASYYPGWMPGGYVYEATLEIDGGEIFIFTNSDGAIAQFSYSTNTTTSSIFVESVDYEYQKVLINGMVGDLYISPNDHTRSELLWRDSANDTLFCISAIADADDLIKAAESVTKK